MSAEAELKKLQDEMGEMFSHIKGLHEEVKEERKSLDSASKKGDEWLEKLNGVDLEAVKTVSAKLTAVEEKLQRIQLERERPAAPAHDAAQEAKFDPYWAGYFKGAPGHPELTQENKDAAREAFWKYARVGKEQMVLEEVKLLSTHDAENGGFLVVPEFANEIIKDLALVNAVRSIARVRPTGSNSFQIPKRTGRVSGGWVGEAQASTESSSTYGLVDIPNGKIFAHSRITNEELADARFAMEEQLRSDFVEEYDRLEGISFVDGDGVKKPRGFMTHPDVIAVNGGHASDLTYTGLVRVSHGDATNGDFNPQYLRNARFVFSSTTLGTVRLLEDTAGNLIYATNTAAGSPGMVLGYPFTLLPGMPAVAANAHPVAFGDFRQAYTILDRIGFELLRNPYSEDTSGIVRFTAYKRVGADIVNEFAIRKLKIAA